MASGTEENVIGHQFDEDLDLALLHVAADAGRSCLRLACEADLTGHTVVSHGFRRDRSPAKYPDGFPMHPAKVSGTTTLVWRGQPVDLFVLVDAEAPQGMSGAPAIDDQTKAVVGILRLAETANAETYAIPAQAAALRWPRLVTPRDEPFPSFADLTQAAIPEALAATAWKSFEPSVLHCVVVSAECQASAEGADSLRGLVQEVLDHPNSPRIWDAFAGAWRSRALVCDGRQREIASAYSRGNVKLATFDVADAYAGPESLDLAVKLVVEADLALFDVTEFEPGVMLLLGVRGASRRGVTINSHGGGWREGEPLNRPFNLSDLSLSSHTPPTVVGEDPRM